MEYRLKTTPEPVRVAFRLESSEKGKNLVDNRVSRCITESSLGETTVQPSPCEVVIPLEGSLEADTQMDTKYPILCWVYKKASNIGPASSEEISQA